MGHKLAIVPSIGYTEVNQNIYMRQLKISQQITKRETKSLQHYLTDISKIDLITAEEEVELAKKIQNGDEAALDKLTTANLRFVVSVAKQYQNQGMSLTDLINEGNLGLVKAARRFDETRGFKFISYAVWWIRQSILQAINEHGRTVRIPLNKISELSKIKKSKLRLQQHLERKPTHKEIADDLDMSKNRVANTLQQTKSSFSMDASLGGDENNFSMHSFLESDDMPRPDHNLMRESLKTEVRRAVDSLSDKESLILKLNFGLGKYTPTTLTEIGEELNLSRERVRQIKSKAIRRLGRRDKSAVLMTYLG